MLGKIAKTIFGSANDRFIKKQYKLVQKINALEADISCAACAIAAVISQIGDLAASAIKRNHQVKDYGTLIPGHGGILDRFDSVIITAPVIYYLAKMILGI